MHFKNWLEANYGALQTDNRIERLSDQIVYEMRDKISKMSDELPDQIRNFFWTEIPIKYKGRGGKQIVIWWIILFRDPGELNFPFFYGGKYRIDDPVNFTDHSIVLYFNEKNKSVENVIEALKGDVLKWLRHEVKHLLDTIDKVFTKDDYQDSGSDFDAYITQNKEIQSFLISVIEELRQIQASNSSISFDEALKLSEIWPLITGSLKKHKLYNKFLQKMMEFWNRKNTPKDDLTYLKQKLLRHLYVFYRHERDKYSRNRFMSLIKDIASKYRTREEIEKIIEKTKNV